MKKASKLRAVWRKIFNKWEVGDVIRFKTPQGEKGVIVTTSVGWNPPLYYVHILSKHERPGWYYPDLFEYLGDIEDCLEIPSEVFERCRRERDYAKKA